MAYGEGSIFQRADGMWIGRLQRPPGPDGRKRSPATVSSKDRNVVIAGMDKLRAQLRETGDIPDAGMSVAAWCDYWTRQVGEKTRRPSTMTSYRSVLDAWVKPTIGHVRLDRLQPADIRRVIFAMESEGLTARNAHTVMQAVFKDAWRDNRIPQNPVAKVEVPRRNVTELEVLEVDETRRLLDAFADSPDAYLWATFLLTGARRGEVIGLEWDRVVEIRESGEVEHFLDLSWQLQRVSAAHPVPKNYEKRQIAGGLYWTRPKTRAGYREIPLVHPLLGIIDQWRGVAPPNDYGLVFTRTDQRGAQIPLDPDYITRLWPKVRAAAGIDRNVRLHDLRHTAVDLMYAAGVDEDVIKQIVGHSTVEMSRSYRSKRSRVARARLAAAMHQYSRSLGFDAPTRELEPRSEHLSPKEGTGLTVQKFNDPG